MARARFMPHRTADSSAVTWGGWWIRLNGQRRPVEDTLPGWDYASELTVELQPSIDWSTVAEQTGVGDPAGVDVVILLDCPATGMRFTSAQPVATLLSSDSNVMVLEPPSTQLADAVRLSAHLAVNRSTIDAESGAVVRIGSRLAWSDPRTVRLEGENPRFPTEAVSFSQLGLEDALWTLQVRFTDLQESFLGGVRLLVNTDHPSSAALLDTDHSHWSVLQPVLKMDIARQLLLHVSFEAFDLTDQNWPEESVRDVLEHLTDLYFGSDLATTAQLVRSDHQRFERRLQSRFELLRNLK